MHFPQVALTVLAYSSTVGGTVAQSPSPIDKISILAPTSGARIVVEREYPLTDGWVVRLIRGALQPPMYFPPVHTEEGLQDALARAWELHRLSAPPRAPAPFLSRFLEPLPASLPSSPRSRSASPPPPQRGWTTRTSPRPG